MANKTRIAVPATVVSEAQYFYSKKLGKQVIDLQKQVDEKLIDCLEASVDEFNAVVREFTQSFCDAIHDGEKEGLGLLLSDRFPELSFCTGDTNAIQAGAMLGISDKMRSFERMIQSVGLQKQISVPHPSLTEKSFEHHAGLGKTRRITREYFVTKLV